ncbi:hypothetical protein WICMUC_005027 [Wickerhamomyces mucosus]|uniref:Uncharacterized protein n=1 Tax=Wickerhamomyces mucosus TaxID=1378264 RepID=A0A9P8PBF7_9ASCO|nr:hypothetical protein WICMUC_005027 [Wickerhamomyces mucosus]
MMEFLHVKDYDRNLNNEFESKSLGWERIIAEFRSSLYSFIMKIRSLKERGGDSERQFTVLLESDLNLMGNWILDSKSDDIDILSIGSGTHEENMREKSRNDSNYKTLPITPVDIGPVIFYPSIDLPN